MVTQAPQRMVRGKLLRFLSVRIDAFHGFPEACCVKIVKEDLEVRLVTPTPSELESALAEVASHLPEAEGGFVFRIYEYLVMEDVLEIVRIEDGITEKLSGLQSNGFGLYVQMRR